MDYPVFETEKAFQLDLASDMLRVGWEKTIVEYAIPGTQYSIDILACGGRIRATTVVECKKSRPDSLSGAIAQVLKYRGAMRGAESFHWALSWPGEGPSQRDKQRMSSHRVSWLDPAEVKNFAKNPLLMAEPYLDSLEEEIETYEALVRSLRKTYDKLARKTEVHKSALEVLQAVKGNTHAIASIANALNVGAQAVQGEGK